ncbi:uncharacterized protein M6B38_340330 [Iris pallida]|uniref:Uncharacterized protein n=1 Tax=Iris pallida TaxID=29817 RepID=A0AAX6GYG3_IRIPA|nr:uncharacterized protein M6B38_340330 [Iris pallida]
MSKLVLLLGKDVKSRVSSLHSITMMRITSKNFSAEAAAAAAGKDSSVDQFLHPPQGLVFGRVTGTGVGNNTMKSDIIHYFEGCNLSTADVKVEYNRAYNPVALMLQFPSQSSYDTALRQVIRKGRLYKIEKVNRGQWDLATAYDGKAILLQGIPRNALPDDIERFLSGTNYDPNFQPSIRLGPVDSIRFALVQFPTRTDAMNAFLTRNKSFCLNSPVIMRLLQ